MIVPELDVDRLTQRASPRAFGRLSGKDCSWAGGSATFATTAVMHYYSIVTGLCFRYLFPVISGNLVNLSVPATKPQAGTAARIPAKHHEGTEGGDMALGRPRFPAGAASPSFSSFQGRSRPVMTQQRSISQMRTFNVPSGGSE